ncbi:unnamed protein product [Orchesella dallaii]|uniref:Rabphilin-3A n=1 Tax=Orchesella dallaii TaxID=48710 RepID=A0ABP1RSI7_9HEXA
MSSEFGLRGPRPTWACPNDRQLALRARLQSGWSLKTNQFNTYPKPQPLTDKEQQMIVNVVKKAEELEIVEQKRVGKLVDRLESLKKLATGNGVTECILCGDTFGLSVFVRSNYKCHDCEKAVCRKCVVEISQPKPGSSTKETMVRLCKLCSENRELIKKSGAWFYKGVPKYVLPEKKNHYTNSYEKYAASPRYQEQKYVSRYVNASPTTTTAVTCSTSTATASSSSNSTSSVSRPGGFFWSRNLQSRSQSDQDNESSSGDEGAAANFASKHHLHQRNGEGSSLKKNSLSVNSGGGAGSNSSDAIGASPTSSLQPPGLPSAGSATDAAEVAAGSGTTLSRKPSFVQRHFHFHHQKSEKASKSRETSPIPPPIITPNEEQRPSTIPSSSSVSPSGQGAPTLCLPTSVEPSTSSFDLLSSTRKKSVSSDKSENAEHQTQSQHNGGGSTQLGGAAGGSGDGGTGSNNGDNNRKSSESSSNDCLYQQNNSTPSISNSSAATTATQSSPLGIIEVALLYDDSHQALHCSVLHAKDLSPMDIDSLADPYCILKLIPSRFEGTHLRTKTVHKSVNPVFNETLTFYGVTLHDLTWQTLQILVIDDDRWGKDCLGSSQIPLHRLRSQQTRSFAQNLERGRLSEEKEWGRGRLLLSLTYLTEKSLLLVGVIQAQDLPALDHNGTSDPFVKVRLLHDSSLGALSTGCFSVNRKFRTSVKWRTLNPEFREEFSLKVSIVDLPRLALVISVWDKDLGKNDDYIGGIVLSTASKGPRLQHWLEMLRLPNARHFKWHTISPSELPTH